jgi:flagellar FliL protein
MSDTNAPAPKKRRRFLKFLLVVLIAVAGGGAGAYFYFFKATPAHAEEAKPEPPPPPPTGIVALDPFVVNLADTGATRFLRVTLSLVVQDEERTQELEENDIEKARIRSAILELLAEQNAGQLVTPEGKDELKKTIAARIEHAAHELKVVDVLFSEFVIQF